MTIRWSFFELAININCFVIYQAGDTIFITFILFKAEAEMAYELQAAKTKQRIKEEQMQIAVVERTQEIAVQKWEVQRREKELDSTVRRSVRLVNQEYTRYSLVCSKT